MNAGEKVFVSWSGGKDAYLALLKAREAGLQPGCLLTFINKDRCSMSHNLPVELLSSQARALNLPRYWNRLPGIAMRKVFTGFPVN